MLRCGESQPLYAAMQQRKLMTASFSPNAGALFCERRLSRRRS
jgi:hypothetical protein